jgi:hypothetical protein
VRDAAAILAALVLLPRVRVDFLLEGFGLRVSGFGFQFSDSGFRIRDLGVGVSNFGFRIGG